jgi:hypothetical protein
MTPFEPGQVYRLSDVMSLSAVSAPSKKAEPAKPAKPKIVFSVAKQTALRKAFKAGGVSEDVVDIFLEMMPEQLAWIDQGAGVYQASRAALKALRADKCSRRHLRDAGKALKAALQHLEAVEHVPPLEALQMQAVIEATQRAQNVLEQMQFSMAKMMKRPGPVGDLKQPLALNVIASLFQHVGLRLVTTPDGLFATAARILLKRTTDDDFSPKDLLSAIRHARS